MSASHPQTKGYLLHPATGNDIDAITDYYLLQDSRYPRRQRYIRRHQQFSASSNTLPRPPTP